MTQWVQSRDANPQSLPDPPSAGIATRPYKTIEFEKRRCLAQLVLVQGLSIAKAARTLEIKYEAAKQIVREAKRKGHCEPLSHWKKETTPGTDVSPVGMTSLADKEAVNHFGPTFRNAARDL